MDLESKEYTLAKLLILRIKRMIDKCEVDHRDFSESEIVRLALNTLRIMCEIYYGNGKEDPHEWDFFFRALKSERDFQLYLHHEERMSLVKNTLLNEIIDMTDAGDLEEFFKSAREDDLKRRIKSWHLKKLKKWMKMISLWE